MNDQNTSSHLADSHLAESLSALMDGQVSELELQRMLKATSEDADLRAKWNRYHVAHAALKKDLTQLAPADFASRISAAIDVEDKLDIVQSQSPKTKASGSAVLAINNWWANIGRVAIAASVAGAVVLGVQQMQTQSGETGELVASSEKVAPLVQDQPAVNLPSGINAPELTARTVAVQSGFESRPNQNRRVAFVPRQSAQPVNADEVSAYVNELMEVHSDNAARNSGQGVLPFTRVILTEDE
jgi:sigma-E factor negative regulatory protein RseA